MRSAHPPYYSILDASSPATCIVRSSADRGYAKPPPQQVSYGMVAAQLINMRTVHRLKVCIAELKLGARRQLEQRDYNGATPYALNITSLTRVNNLYFVASSQLLKLG